MAAYGKSNDEERTVLHLLQFQRTALGVRNVDGGVVRVSP